MYVMMVHSVEKERERKIQPSENTLVAEIIGRGSNNRVLQHAFSSLYSSLWLEPKSEGPKMQNKL